jgi:predicted histone-like DNA-binding protein
VQKVNPSKPTDPKKYYANLVTRGDVSLRELAKEITEISTVSPPDVMVVIEAPLQIILRHLIQGEIVRLGDFGSFSVRLSSEGADAPEAFNASLVKSVNLNFRPGSVSEREAKAQ